MTPRHHPSQTVLLGYASGSLGRGASLVVQAHLDACPTCGEDVRRLEEVGGALLEALEPAALAPDALQRTLERLGSPQSGRRAQGIDLSGALDGLPLGRRRWLGPGVWIRPIVRDGPARACVLRVGPGAALLEHGHLGDEYVQVLKGAFRDETGRYGPGDFAQSDERLAHRPVAEREGECVCLVWFERPMRMRTGLGRLLQPLVGL